MRNNETGEFELVVGNRQLLAGFFIVVLLFAVAFAMGYVVGQNSRGPKTLAGAPSASAQPQAAETRPQPSMTAPPPEQPAQQPAPKEAADAGSQPMTQPVREAEPAAAPAPAPAPARQAAPAAEGPGPGSYWQVIATANRESAQTIVQSLRDKGFPASMSPGPANLTRVLVGPYADSAAMGRAKTELEGAGFNKLVTFKKQ
jgi:cell division septation protein DedD